MLNVDDLVNELRGVHPSFDRGRVAPIVARQFLVRATNFILGQISDEDEDIAAVEASVSARREDDEALPGYLDALEDAANVRNRVEIAPFSNITDNIMILNDEGRYQEVFMVPLSQQYPGDYDESDTFVFPSLGRRGSFLHLTDLRVLGESNHGWEQLPGPLLFNYVPYFEPGEANYVTLEVPKALRGAIISRAGEQLALRIGEYRYHAQVKGEFGVEVVRVINQLAHAGSGFSQVS